MLTVSLLLVHQEVLQKEDASDTMFVRTPCWKKQACLSTRDHASIKDSLDSNSEGNTVEICINTERFDVTTWKIIHIRS